MNHINSFQFHTVSGIVKPEMISLQTVYKNAITSACNGGVVFRSGQCFAGGVVCE